ncbi:MAG: shikimate kinase [Terriglobales bacterium]
MGQVGADLGHNSSDDNIAHYGPGSAMGVRAVFLVGFMASGKSSVGQELARRLNWDFVDLDTRIESRERQTIPEIFRASGECGFRLAETRALCDLLTESLQRNSVVALGGGAFVQEKNRELLRQWPSVFLEAPLSELWQRSLADGIERPLRGDPERFAQLYAQRLPFYRQATVVVETTGKPLASICVEIEEALKLRRTQKDAGPNVT